MHFENSFSFANAQFLTATEGSKNVWGVAAVPYLSQLKGNFLPGQYSVRNLSISLESGYSFRQQNPLTRYATEIATVAYWLIKMI